MGGAARPLGRALEMSRFLDLYWQRLRRDRWQLLSWVASIGALAFFATTAVASAYGDDASRAEILHVATATPAILILRGLVRGPALDAFTFFQIFAFLGVLAGLMNTFMAVRHTRAEEEAGRAELVASTAAGRWMPLTATVTHGLVGNVLVAAAVTFGFISGGLDAAGSLVAGLAAGAIGWAFLTVGLLASEFMSTSRGANGAAAGLVVAAYLLRGFGDATGDVSQDGLTVTAAWPSWVSPIGWGQQTFAYTGNRWWPLLLPLGLGIACVSLTAVIMSKRDVGASVLAGRRGRTNARSSLRGPFALALRLQQGAIVSWCIGGFIAGLLTGALGAAIQQVSITNSSVTAILRAMIEAQGTSMTELVIAVLFEIGGILAAACGLQAVLRLRQEEVAGTAELVLSQPLGRIRWFGSFLGLGAVSVVLVMVFAAFGAWYSLLVSGETAVDVGNVWETAGAQIPAALLYLALPAAVFVTVPRATVPIGWALLALGVVLGVYGGMLGFDKTLRDISPFTHTPVVTTTGTDWSGGFWMLGIGAALVVFAFVAVRRREVGTV